MRIPHQEQLQLDCTPVGDISLNPNCRDSMIPMLRALQYLYSRPALRDQALALVAVDVLQDADSSIGRTGMTLWQIFVLASLRLGRNLTYDHLQYLAENDRTLQQMLQVGDWSDATFNFRKIHDNVCRVHPETIRKINELVVGEGHRLVPAAPEAVRGDAFVAETNVHWPTESGLILDGLRKILLVAPELAGLLGLLGWRQSKSLFRKAKKACRAIGRVKKGNNYEQRLLLAYQPLFHVAQNVLPRTAELLDEALARLNGDSTVVDVKVLGLYRELVYWHSVTNHVCGTARRRVIDGEQVPNSEKLFSLFEPDTELIMRGKAGQPIQFGHVVLVIEDAVGFICHYKVLPIQSDERDVLVPEMQTLQTRLNGRIRSASFDRGFHSPSNQIELAKIVNCPCLPQPGAKQSKDQEQHATIHFRQARQRHPGIESAIGALQSGNGLARCRDHSQLGYQRYIGLGILGRNLLVLGKLLLSQEHPNCLAAYSRRDTQAA